MSRWRLLERGGRDDEAIAQYTTAVTANPTFVAAHLKLADALRRNDRLEPALTHYRRVIDLQPADVGARFGEAMALVRLERYAEARERLTEEQHPAVFETMAMVLAELGHFELALDWQRLAMSSVARAGRSDVAQQMAINLALYETRQPCRTPWRDDDPDHRPGPLVDPALLDPPLPR